MGVEAPAGPELVHLAPFSALHTVHIHVVIPSADLVIGKRGSVVFLSYMARHEAVTRAGERLCCCAPRSQRDTLVKEENQLWRNRVQQLYSITGCSC
jgi:hypothetical protein